jgi:hypothetical protein
LKKTEIRNVRGGKSKVTVLGYELQKPKVKIFSTLLFPLKVKVKVKADPTSYRRSSLCEFNTEYSSRTPLWLVYRVHGSEGEREERRD